MTISQQLLEHYVRNPDSFSANSVGPPSHSFGPPPRHDRFQHSNNALHGPGAPYPSGFHDGDARPKFPPEFLTFRLLCSEEKVGGVIGKSGAVVKGLQHETGCDIKVLEGEGNSDDRIITISGPCVCFVPLFVFLCLDFRSFQSNKFLMNIGWHALTAVSR